MSVFTFFSFFPLNTEYKTVKTCPQLCIQFLVFKEEGIGKFASFNIISVS